MIAVDSPPGISSPSSPESWSGFRTSTTSAPRLRSIVACSRKLPWSARTPIRRRLSMAPIVVTVSPVPVDSVIGLADPELRSAIEVDCVSKSRLRSALDTVLPTLRKANVAIHYFPAFEIVRWIAPMLAIPSFGSEDAASRHVSSPVLDSVCSLFMEHFIKLPEVTRTPDGDNVSRLSGGAAGHQGQGPTRRTALPSIPNSANGSAT